VSLGDAGAANTATEDGRFGCIEDGADPFDVVGADEIAHAVVGSDLLLA